MDRQQQTHEQAYSGPQAFLREPGNQVGGNGTFIRPVPVGLCFNLSLLPNRPLKNGALQGLSEIAFEDQVFPMRDGMVFQFCGALLLHSLPCVLIPPEEMDPHLIEKRRRDRIVRFQKISVGLLRMRVQDRGMGLLLAAIDRLQLLFRKSRIERACLRVLMPVAVFAHHVMLIPEMRKGADPLRDHGDTGRRHRSAQPQQDQAGDSPSRQDPHGTRLDRFGYGSRPNSLPPSQLEQGAGQKVDPHIAKAPHAIRHDPLNEFVDRPGKQDHERRREVDRRVPHVAGKCPVAQEAQEAVFQEVDRLFRALPKLQGEVNISACHACEPRIIPGGGAASGPFDQMGEPPDKAEGDGKQDSIAEIGFAKAVVYEPLKGARIGNGGEDEQGVNDRQTVCPPDIRRTPVPLIQRCASVICQNRQEPL